MAVDIIGRSVLVLSTDNRALNQGIKKGKKGADGLKKSFSGVGKAIAGIFSIILIQRATSALVEYSDQWTRVNNQLKIVTDSSEELARVQTDLFDIAQRTRAPIDATVKLYSRLALAAEELGATQEELLQFTEGVGQGLAITNTSVQEARGSLLQLSQALGSGIVRAEEFNSILEGTPRIARAVADGMDLTVAKLRSLVIAGKLTSSEFFRAFQSQLPVLRQEFDQTSITIGQASTIFSNSMTKFIGTLDSVTGSSTAVAAAITKVATRLDELSAKVKEPGFIDKIKSIGTSLQTAFKFTTVGVLVEQMSGLIAVLNQKLAKNNKLAKEAAGISGDPSAGTGLGSKLAEEEAKRRQAVLDKVREELAQKRLLAEFEGAELIALQERLAVEATFKKQKIDLEDEEARAILAKVFAQTKELEKRKELEAASKAAAAAQKAQSVAIQKTFATSLGAVTADLFTGKAAFEDFGKTVIKLIAQMIVKLVALKIASSFLSGFTGGLGGQLAGGLFGGARAGGGDVQQGRSFLVGERGPELFTPSSSGFITPNDKMGGSTINLTQNMPITALDFGDEQVIRRVGSGLSAAARSGVTEVVEAGAALNDASNANAGNNLG